MLLPEGHHVLKDRMERTGMRWIMEGAKSMLDLRGIHLSGLWDEYQDYWINQENKRLYSNLPANDDLYKIRA